MSTIDQIEAYLAIQPAPKQADLRALHSLILGIAPQAPLWFLDGKDEHGKTVSNPNIGYGALTLDYADGTSRAFYKIGLSANTSGISIYIMGLEDRTYLPQTYGKTIGNATVTGYCVRFRSLAGLDRGALDALLCFGLGERGAHA
jgi:hypothetical protein